MAEVRPFRGFRYAEGVAVDDVVAPPWDVISPQRQKELAGRSVYNVTHLEAQDVVPEESARLFASWVRDGVLAQDTSPSFYLLRHRFTLNGRREERTGFFGLVRMEPFEKRVVIPHERVFERFRDNRQRLIAATGAYFSPVFLLCRDPDGLISRASSAAEPVASGRLDGDELELGRICDPAAVASLSGLCAGQPLIIADGHHRYQASLNACDAGEGDPWCLVYVADLLSPSLRILPTHRFIRQDVRLPEAVDRLKEVFEVTGYDDQRVFLRDVLGAGRHVFGARSCEGMWRLWLRSEDALRSLVGDRHPAVARLDSVILHDVILERMLGVREGQFIFGQDPEDLFRLNDEAGSGAVFLLNAVSPEDFADVVMSGEVMPQKSTYFYPKVPSGLVFHRFKP